MSKKFYKVVKENFLWHVGAILELNERQNGYVPYEGSTVWDVSGLNEDEYISCRVVESSPEYFEQVYPVNLIKNIVFKGKEEARRLLEGSFQ